MSIAAKLLRKISPATVYDTLPRLDIPGAPTEKVLYDVYGMTNGVKSGSTEKGDWLSFKGQFEAVTPDGELFASGQVFLPQPFEDMLYSQLKDAQGADDKASVQFAVRVFIVAPKKGKPSAVGYEYRCQPLIDAQESSPIAALRNQVKTATLALAAPAPAAEIVTEESPKSLKSVGGKK